jgi:hypothetical protein
MSTWFRKFTILAMTFAFALATAVVLPAESLARGGKGGGRSHGGGGHKVPKFHNAHKGGHKSSSHRYKSNNNKHHHHYNHDHWHNHYNHYGRWAGAAIGAATIGAIVYSLPPSCVRVVRNGVAYRQCGSDWYAPRYQGSSVSYVVVRAP